MRQAILEALPGRRCHSDVIGVVNAPVCAGKDLLRLIRINDDRVHRNIRQIAGLIGPGKSAAIGRACYLEHVTRCRWRISIETADRCVSNWEICGWHGRVQRDAHHRAIGQNRIVSSDIYPGRLRLRPRAKVKAYPGIAVVRADNGNALILRRVLYLINKRTVPQCLLGHVLRGRIVRYVPIR